MNNFRELTSGQRLTLIILGVIALFVLLGTGFAIYNINNQSVQIPPTINPTVFTQIALPTFPATYTLEPTDALIVVIPTETVSPTETPVPQITLIPPEVFAIPGQVQPYQPGSTPAVIGTSVAGRPIEVVRFGNGLSNRMIVAGIHGGAEANTTALADEMIAYLSENPNVIPEGVSLYILRSLNPDGLDRELGPGGRVNDHDVDLNRNWDANWSMEWNWDGCWTAGKSFGGEYPHSEPETKTLENFLTITPIDALISYHSAALGIFPGGDPRTEDSIRLAEAVDAVTDYPYPPIETGCNYTGMMVDWTANHGIPSMDLELANHQETDFDTNLKVLDVLLNFQK